MIKILILFSLWLTIAESQVYTDNCWPGPVKLPSYICRCPYRPTKEEISPCIRHCVTDLFWRLCTGDPQYNIPALCPLVMKNEVDLSGENYNFVFKKGLKIYGFDKAVANDLLYFDPQTMVVRSTVNVPKLKIEGEYKFNGILCSSTSEHHKGSVTIKLEDVVLDWFPHVELTERCNLTYFWTNAQISNLTLINNKPVEFDFKPDCKYSKCFNRNWYDVLEKLRTALQKLLSDAGAYFANSIVQQSPITEVFDFTI